MAPAAGDWTQCVGARQRQFGGVVSDSEIQLRFPGHRQHTGPDRTESRVQAAIVEAIRADIGGIPSAELRV